MKNNKDNSSKRNSTKLPMAMIAAALATVLSSVAMAQHQVRINFDAAGCPQHPVADVAAGRGQQITWQAYQNGVEARVPFDIYFDPLRGQPHNGNNGTVRANIDPAAPRVDYKYTIVGGSCPNNPLDPNIRVN